jgi:hypothetical protein
MYDISSTLPTRQDEKQNSCLGIQKSMGSKQPEILSAAHYLLLPRGQDLLGAIN